MNNLRAAIRQIAESYIHTDEFDVSPFNYWLQKHTGCFHCLSQKRNGKKYRWIIKGDLKERQPLRKNKYL